MGGQGKLERGRGRARRGLVATVASLLLLTLAGSAEAASLYSGPGPRPGPDILYAPPPPTPPQLQNTGVWRASPLLVSGASAYRDGEFLYQDWLYDDHGARVAPDPNDPSAQGNTFSKPGGTYTYPTDRKYANDAADFVELRVKPLADATAFRVTLNALEDPSLVAFSVAIGGNPAVKLPFPHGANVVAPADLFLTVHPSGSALVGELVNAATGTTVPGPAPVVSVDSVRRQIEVRIPHTEWDPTGKVVRLAAGVGLWDKSANSYLVPQAAADATHPGGGRPGSAAFFNVAFRANSQEPMPPVTSPDNVTGPAVAAAWWRDSLQGADLANGDISDFHADVDFRKLAAGTDDDSGVPVNGPMDRILPSRFETGQGADFSVACLNDPQPCPGEYQGRLQPYAIYVPRKPAPPSGYGMTLLMHSLSAAYNQFLNSKNASEFADRGPGSIVITPESRGPDGVYYNLAGAEVFEVWADVARLYHLDPDWAVIAGYSMGGFGTFKLGEEFPDLFARAQPTVGTDEQGALASLRNLPILMWNAAADELVPVYTYTQSAQTLDDLGYRYELDVFSGEHLTLAVNDEYAPAAAFLGTAKVDRNPPHVTYVADPAGDYPSLGFVGDHAYWVSGVRLRVMSPTGQVKAGAPLTPVVPVDRTGTIDVFSHGFGVGDPKPSATSHGGGALTGGNSPALAFTSQAKTWGPAPRIPVADELDVNATNVRSVTVDHARARVSCAPRLNVKSDGPIDVIMGGCSLGLPSNAACVDRRGFSFKLHHAPRARVVRVEAFVNGKRVIRRRGRNLARVTLRQLPQGSFKVKIVATQSSGSKLVSTRTYRGCTKSRPRTRGHHHR